MAHQWPKVMYPTPLELEYFVENELIEIVPNFTAGEMYFIRGDVGPFKAGLPIKVPLWYALDLREKNKCRITTPDWMNEATLVAAKKREFESTTFTKMPHEHYFGFAQLLIKRFPMDVVNSDVVKLLIKDIWDNRSAKLRTSLFAIVESGVSEVKVDNLTMLEIATVRPFLPHILQQYYRFIKTGEAAKVYVNSQLEIDRRRDEYNREARRASSSSASHSQSQSQSFSEAGTSQSQSQSQGTSQSLDQSTMEFDTMTDE